MKEKTACRNNLLKYNFEFILTYWIYIIYILYIYYLYFLEGDKINSHLKLGLVNKWIESYSPNSGKTKSNELIFLI